MATGISTDKVHSLQVSLLDSIESLKAICEKYDNCSISISSNIEGAGKTSIISDLEKMKNQLAIVISNFDSYITDLNKIVDSYINQDDEINQQIINDVKNIEVMEGDK